MPAPSPRQPFLLRFLVAAISAGLAGACGAEPRSSASAAAAFQDTALHPIHIGLDDDLERHATLGIVIAARVTGSGRHVVVLDLVPPFVKVFGADGRLRSAFLHKGSGPEEMKGPATIAVHGDTAILVADQEGRLSVYDFSGTLLRQIHPAGLIALGASEFCDGQWMVYGPRFQTGSATVANWLHRVRFTRDSLVVQSAVRDSMASEAFGIGRPYGMTRTRRGAMVRHDLGTSPSVLSWNCDEDVPHVTVLPAEASRSRVKVTPGSGPRTVRPGTRIQMGIAALASGFVLADVTVEPRPPGATTVLELTTPDGREALSLPGAFSLRDSRPGVGVLIETPEPVPQVFLIPEATFSALFGSR